MEQILEFFPEISGYDDPDYRRIAIAKPTLMIAMTARTGSTHLCAALGKLLHAGEPTEIFNPRGIVQWEKQRRGVASFGDYLASLQGDARSFFVFKTNWLDFQPWTRAYKLLFPDLRLLYLDRLDIEAQAVSLFKAVISNRWHQRSNAEAPPSAPPSEPRDAALAARFDIVEICRHVTSLENEKNAWEKFFFAEGLYPLRLNYENFSESLPQALRYIGNWLNLEISESDIPDDDYVRLADGINAEWVAKTKNYRTGGFYAEQKRRGILP